MQFRLLLTLLLFFFSITSYAQPITSIENEPTLLAETTESWIFFEKDKTLFIDFETIASTVNDIRIKTENDAIQFTDVVADLPQDAIYELDLSMLPEGNYIIEIRTYQEVLSKKIKV